MTQDEQNRQRVILSNLETESQNLRHDLRGRIDKEDE